MAEPPETSPSLTVELTAKEAQTLAISLAADIKRRTVHMRTAVYRRAAIETELKSLQAVYDKLDAARSFR